VQFDSVTSTQDVFEYRFYTSTLTLNKVYALTLNYDTMQSKVLIKYKLVDSSVTSMTDEHFPVLDTAETTALDAQMPKTIQKINLQTATFELTTNQKLTVSVFVKRHDAQNPYPISVRLTDVTNGAETFGASTLPPTQSFSVAAQWDQYFKIVPLKATAPVSAFIADVSACRVSQGGAVKCVARVCAFGERCTDGQYQPQTIVGAKSDSKYYLVVTAATQASYSAEVPFGSMISVYEDMATKSTEAYSFTGVAYGAINGVNTKSNELNITIVTQTDVANPQLVYVTDLYVRVCTQADILSGSC